MTLSIIQQIVFCGEKRFTGKLSVTTTGNDNVNHFDGTCWNLYFFRGRLVGDSAGVHPVRRLRRQFSKLQLELPAFIEERFFVSIDLQERNYFVVKQLLAEHQINREQAELIVQGSLKEVLFDIVQYEMTAADENEAQLTYLFQTEPGEEKLFPAVLLRPETVLQEAIDQFKIWCEQGLANYSSNLTPYINDPVVLQNFTSAKSYENMINLLDGDRTLLDISVKVNEDLFSVMKSTLKYYNLGFVSFRLMPDLNPSERKLTTALANYQMPSLTAHHQAAAKNALVAHLGLDNLEIKTTVENAGHGYVNFAESSRTMVNLLQYQPNLILVDSLTTNINTNEFCGQVRRTNKFKDTPIVFFNNNVGVMGRLLNRIEHSTEYISRHLGQQELLIVLQKYM